MRTFTSPEELIAAVGEHLGYSGWHQIDQERVNLFADATGDHQWIHVDAEKAAQGPFGTTIAHGFLMLSLFPQLMTEVYRVDGVRMGINYGLNKVRFPAVLPVGSKVRAGGTLVSVDRMPDGGYQIVAEATLEREGGEKPCCVAQTIARIYF
jgi:acyl dehydratase